MSTKAPKFQGSGHTSGLIVCMVRGSRFPVTELRVVLGFGAGRLALENRRA